jgi:hypothetical protein
MYCNNKTLGTFPLGLRPHAWDAKHYIKHMECIWEKSSSAPVSCNNCNNMLRLNIPLQLSLFVLMQRSECFSFQMIVWSQFLLLVSDSLVFFKFAPHAFVTLIIVYFLANETRVEHVAYVIGSAFAMACASTYLIFGAVLMLRA